MLPDSDNPAADDIITVHTLHQERPDDDGRGSGSGDEAEPLVEITRAGRIRQYREDTKHLALHQRWWQWFLKHWLALVSFVMPTPQRVLRYFKSSFPVIDTVRAYPSKWRENLLGDVVAGLAISTLLIPQVLSYSTVAGLPPVYGLYSSFVPMSMYMIFGTSHHINVGPVAVVSLLVNNALHDIVSYDEEPERYVACAIYLTMLVGIWNLGFGMLNIGFLLRLLSPAFIAAFVTASAFTIGSTQLGSLFGFSVPNSSYIWAVVVSVCQNLNKTQWLPFLMGFSSIVIIIVCRKKYPSIPIAFIIIVVMTFIAWTIIHYNNAFPNWPVTGKMPPGLPGFKVPSVSSADAISLIAPSFIITFIGYMESYSLAVKIGEKHGHKIRGSQEFIALGAANFVGSFFQAYPVTGSFSRTAEAELQNAKTILYTLVSVVSVIISLLFLTPVYYYIPKSILAATIIAAVYRLIDFETMVKYYHTSTMDFLIWWFTFIGVIAGGTENGMAIGVGFSFIVLIFQHMFPYIAYLGKAVGPDGKAKLLNIKRFPQAKADPDILIMRFDHSLVFLNKDYFMDKVTRRTTALAELVETEGDHIKDAPEVAPKVFILDGSAIHHVDIFGAEALLQVTRKLRARGITPLFAYMRSNVKDVLIDTGLMEEIDSKSMYLSVDDAAEAAEEIVRGASPVAVLARNSSENNVLGAARATSSKALLVDDIEMAAV